MRRVSVSERRARLAARHHLATRTRATDVETTAGDLVGLHASDPMTVYMAAWARTAGLTRETMSAALYEDRSLLRIVGMRTTMFVVPRDLAAIMCAACARAIGVRERARLAKWIEAAGVAVDGAVWLRDVEADTVTALHELGEATATDLSARIPGLREQLAFGEGSAWQGTVGVSTRILFLLAAEGRILRGRPTGSIVSSRYRWAPMDRWIPGGLAVLPADEARTQLVTRWLTAYGPGTLEDLRWWTGWALRDVRQALATIDTVEVDLDGATGLLLASDAASAPAPAETDDAPWAVLLPSLDPTVMGWAGRDWYLGGHRAALFDRNGNAGPTAWWDGRVVGGWGQRRDGEIVVRLLEDVGTEAAAELERVAANLREWLGPVRVIPRFRTPIETEIAS
jgi:hypothetical protein